MESHQHDSAMYAALTKGELTEVLVRGHEHPRLFRCGPKNSFVVDPGALLCHIRDVVARNSKRLDDRTVDALVADELQGT